MVDRYLLRIVASADPARVGREFPLGRGLVIGRDPDCSVVLADASVSRRHARVEPADGGLRIVDLGSQNGIWRASGRVAVTLLGPGERCRIGSTVFECQLVAATADADATVFMPRPPVPPTAMPDAAAPPRQEAAPPEARREPTADGDLSSEPLTTVFLRSQTDTVTLDAHQPLLLDDPGSAWQVLSGSVLIFTVAVEEGQRAGTRTHLLEVPADEWFFGFDVERYRERFGVIAVPAENTRVRRVSLAHFASPGGAERRAAMVAGMFERWLPALGRALTGQRRSGPPPEPLLRPGEPLALQPARRVSAAAGVVWVKLPSGVVLFNDIACPVFDLPYALFPITPETRLETIGEASSRLPLVPSSTRDAIADPLFWPSVRLFHATVCECEFINLKLAAVDEYLRLEEKAQKASQAAQAGLAAIGSVMTGEVEDPRAAPGGDLLLAACQAVGSALGLEMKRHPGAAATLSHEQRVAAVASASGLRTRVVALRDEWWRGDHGPLLAREARTSTPLALLPAGRARYVLVRPDSRGRAPVDAKVAESIEPFAYSFYRPAPDGELGIKDLLRFGMRGTGRDLRWIALLAVALGLLGTITPYFSGQVLDTAVPQADRGMLVGFGLALVASAIASSLYKLTQDVATIRLEVRMTATIQAAVWDRILNLPVSFFRRYPAGDLADRAGGVEAIQNLMAGAAVAAVLGSISGLFYAGQLFFYSLRLALVALALTLVFVVVNTAGNYLQVRYQRDAMRIRGRIAGLTLNLLTGVAKLRIAGAELHAFRVWAEEFARQRRLSYSGGTLQNVSAVFNGGYPVVSSMVIFYAMYSAQAARAPAGPGLTVGEFFGFTTAFGLFLAAMQALGDASVSVIQAVPIYERLKPVLTTATEIDRARELPGSLTGAIELSHLSFRYGPDAPWVVRDLSLRIAPGEFVAFVGASGCGKSTLMRLMLGFEQPAAGAVRFDGRDLASLDVRMVRQQMGVVLQSSRVTPAEIYRNIVGVTFRTMEDAWEAARQAGLAEDIRQMPMGMYTYVSEGGGTLSGGQRQRLMIARAIVNQPKILFLDEATSALDNRTQAVVTDSMNRMQATRIVIAHRLSTVIDADRICYLENGQIAEMGTYRELMAKDGLFARLAKRQVA